MKARALLLEVGLLVAMVSVTLTLVVAPLLGQGGLGLDAAVLEPFSEPLSVQAELVEPIVQGLPAGTAYQAGEGVELSGPSTTTATVQGALDGFQRLGLVGGRLLLGLTALAALALLLQVVRTLRQGDPFVRPNARRLRAVAGVVAVGGTLSQVVTGSGEVAVLTALTVSDRVVAAAEVSFLPLIAGLVIALLAEVFAQGADLRDDVDGLV